VVAPWLINPLLMIGGLFLCYEGVEKFYIVCSIKAKTGEAAQLQQIETDLATFEKDKIKGAIRTDFIFC
jgi:predicted DNA repair protein MutK